MPACGFLIRWRRRDYAHSSVNIGRETRPAVAVIRRGRRNSRDGVEVLLGEVFDADVEAVGGITRKCIEAREVVMRRVGRQLFAELTVVAAGAKHEAVPLHVHAAFEVHAVGAVRTKTEGRLLVAGAVHGRDRVLELEVVARAAVDVRAPVGPRREVAVAEAVDECVFDVAIAINAFREQVVRHVRGVQPHVRQRRVVGFQVRLLDVKRRCRGTCRRAGRSRGRRTARNWRRNDRRRDQALFCCLRSVVVASVTKCAE